MNDVIPECGGYLPVFIDRIGYIKTTDPPFAGLIHRETRDLNKEPTCCFDFSEAKGWQEVLGNENLLPAVLELTPDGGGRAVWVRPELRDTAHDRLQRWKGCYGAWPIHTFSA